MLRSAYRAVLLLKLCNEMKREYSNVLSSMEPFFHPMYGRSYCQRRRCYRCLKEYAFSNIMGETLENSAKQRTSTRYIEQYQH